MTLSEADNSLLQELSTKFDEMASRLSAQIADLSTQVDLLKRRSVRRGELARGSTV